MQQRLILTLVLTVVSAVSSASQLFQYGMELNQYIRQELSACGVNFVNPYHPGLPYPQVPADEALVGAQGQLLGYYHLRTVAGGNRYEYKAPNGGQIHAVTQGEARLTIQTPYQGIFARIGRGKTTGGYFYRYRCHSVVPLHFNVFQACVYQNYVQVLKYQLCQRDAYQPR